MVITVVVLVIKNGRLPAQIAKIINYRNLKPLVALIAIVTVVPAFKVVHQMSLNALHHNILLN